MDKLDNKIVTIFLHEESLSSNLKWIFNCVIKLSLTYQV